MIHKKNQISNFISTKRKELNLTQVELAERVGVGLRLIRDIEQGKLNLNLAKLLIILEFFGSDLVAQDKRK